MISYTHEKELIDNPHFERQRAESVSGLNIENIDLPIRGLIQVSSKLSCCFTVQCCFGHFVYPGQEDIGNLEPLPQDRDDLRVKYRIAYLAFCVQKNQRGVHLLDELRKIINVDPEFIQFGCAEWFWKRHLNSYVLQVEPERYRMKDEVWLELDEALHVEATRSTFFREIHAVIRNNVDSMEEHESH